MIYTDGDYALKLAAEIFGASRKIDVMMYVWRFYPNDPNTAAQRVYTAMLRAVARGVRVRVLTAFPEVAEQLRADGIEAIAVPASRTAHAKFFILDNEILCVGSHNMTKRALENSHEASIITDDTDVVAHMSKYFEVLWGTYANSKADL